MLGFLMALATVRKHSTITVSPLTATEEPNCTLPVLPLLASVCCWV